MRYFCWLCGEKIYIKDQKSHFIENEACVNFQKIKLNESLSVVISK
jgi:hypothetical protein